VGEAGRTNVARVEQQIWAFGPFSPSCGSPWRAADAEDVKLVSSATSTRSRQSVLQRGAPAFLGVVVILVLGIGALRVGQSNLDAAARDRVASRERLVTAQREQMAYYLDPAHQTTAGRVTLVQPDDTAGQAELLKGVHDDESSPALVAVLLDPNGQVLQSYPQGATVDVGVLGGAWDRARQGQAGVSEAFRRNGDIVTATLWPVGPGTPWGVVVAVSAPAQASRQAFLESLGSMNAEPGGLFLADANGIAVNAWDPSRIGQPMLNAADLANVPTGESATITSSRQGMETTTIATRLADGYTFGFEQETDKLLGDLRATQHQRDLTLLAVLCAALAGLAFFQLARELAARRAEAKVDALLANSQDLVVVADGHGALTFVSAAIESLLGESPRQWLARPLTSVCHPSDEARVERLLIHADTGTLLNVRLRGAGATYKWFDIEASDLRTHPEVGGGPAHVPRDRRAQGAGGRALPSGNS
jgi:PAS domain-containing protein